MQIAQHDVNKHASLISVLWDPAGPILSKAVKGIQVRMALSVVSDCSFDAASSQLNTILTAGYTVHSQYIQVAGQTMPLANSTRIPLAGNAGNVTVMASGKLTCAECASGRG